ncbi:MAG: hypothetical protein K2I35_00745, partial [Duncaniella sp.]|nr:hypothetical protein [Duncaniella sp.]
CGPAVQKRVSLIPIQMGMFNVLDITKFPDGSLWLDFLSDKYAPSKEAMDFIAHCFNKLGKDIKGRGVPCEADVAALRNGLFGRNWDNVKMTQIKRPEHLSLTIALRVIIDNQDLQNFVSNLEISATETTYNQSKIEGGGSQISSHNSSQQTLKLKEGSTIATKPFSGGKIVLLVCLAFFIPLVGPIGVFIYGLIKYFDKNAAVEWSESVPQYKLDRRYKSNRRYIGDAMVKHKESISATPELRAINKNNGMIAMAIGGAMFLLITFIL